jgi:uncharacterized protein YuzE
MEAIAVNEMKNILPWFIKQKTVWANYDGEADVLYLHFKQPNHADHSEMTEDDMIIRYENDEIIGVTVLNVSKK